jgi:hypothetical protein
MLLLPRMQSRDEPVGNPRVELFPGFVHPKKDIIALEPLVNVEGCHVGNSQTGVDRKQDEVLGVLAAPWSMAGAWRLWCAEQIACRVDASEFCIGERHFYWQAATNLPAVASLRQYSRRSTFV